MSRKKRDRQGREKKLAKLIAKRNQLLKDKMREAWPALADALANPDLESELEKNGMVADMEAIERLRVAGIFLAVSSDGRVRFHNLTRANG